MRERNTEIHGIIRAITYPGAGMNMQVRIIVEDEGTRYLLIFQGRRTLACVHVGDFISARGTLALQGAMHVMYNPLFDVRGGSQEKMAEAQTLRV